MSDKRSIALSDEIEKDRDAATSKMKKEIEEIESLSKEAMKRKIIDKMTTTSDALSYFQAAKLLERYEKTLTTSLRDEFAMRILPQIRERTIANAENDAYEVADKMLKARQ